MKTVATHNNGFHADDAFAVATLELIFGELNIVRTRDEDKIQSADIVVDVGRVYNEEQMRFDHHQEGGAGVRENNVPYASFGLVWKKFGEQVCDSKEIASIVDRSLVVPIDADDNGFSISTPKYSDIGVFSISGVIGTFNPTFLEKDVSPDSVFPKVVQLAKDIILREIASAKTIVVTEKIFKEAYDKSEDKRVIVLDIEVDKHAWQVLVKDLSDELLYVVHPYGSVWALRAVRKNGFSFENRKDLPESWAGKNGKDLEVVTGVLGVNFCHNKRFIATANTKEAILKLLDIALNS